MRVTKTQQCVSQEEIQGMMRYNPETGNLIWRVRVSSNTKIGTVAGCYTTNGYRCIRLQGTIYMQSHLVWLYHTGSLPKGRMFYQDGDRLNTRIENLLDGTYSEISRGRKPMKGTASGMNGVHWDKKKKRWRARMYVDGKHIYLGVFKDVDDAYAAYCNKVLELFPLFARI